MPKTFHGQVQHFWSEDHFCLISFLSVSDMAKREKVIQEGFKGDSGGRPKIKETQNQGGTAPWIF